MFDNKARSEEMIGELIEDLYRAARQSSKNGICDYSIDAKSELNRLKLLRPVWNLKLQPIDPEDVDCKSDMFGGYPFTLQKHPWISNSKGKPCYPLIQIDLKNLSELVGEKFGNGLLQVWLDITKSNLDSSVRIIEREDLNTNHRIDYPLPDQIKRANKFGEWFDISYKFEFVLLGYMTTEWIGWDSIDFDLERELSETEFNIIKKLRQISEEHGYRNINANWLLGYPDRGSGSPAGSYDREPMNLIQFATSDVFPMAAVSRLGNLFYKKMKIESNEKYAYFFDWNG